MGFSPIHRILGTSGRVRRGGDIGGEAEGSPERATMMPRGSALASVNQLIALGNADHRGGPVPEAIARSSRRKVSERPRSTASNGIPHRPGYCPDKAAAAARDSSVFQVVIRNELRPAPRKGGGFGPPQGIFSETGAEPVCDNDSFSRSARDRVRPGVRNWRAGSGSRFSLKSRADWSASGRSCRVGTVSGY